MLTSPLFNLTKQNTQDDASIDINLYNFVAGILDKPSNIPSRIAWELENEALRLGWPSKHIMGSENALIKRFDVSRESVREAIRILERRGAMKVLRGRYGGLSLLQPNVQQSSAALVSYLQIYGYSNKHILEAAHIFDRLLIQWLIKYEIFISKPSSKTTLRTQLAAASKESVFLLYATAIDLISDSSHNDKNPEVTKTERLLCESIKRKDQQESERLAKLLPLTIIESSQLDIIKNEGLISSAAKVAIKIVNYSNQENTSSTNNVYHSEWDICQALDEQRSLVRQALRILQDADMLESKTGCAGGFILKQPSPAGIVRQVFPVLACERKNIGRLSTLIWKLNLAQLELTIAALKSLHQEKRNHICQAIESQLNEIEEPKRWIFLQQRIGELSNNPLLDTILKSVVTYLARRGQLGVSYPDSLSKPLYAHETSIINALRSANLNAAITHQKKAQTLLMKLKLDKHKHC